MAFIIHTVYAPVDSIVKQWQHELSTHFRIHETT